MTEPIPTSAVLRWPAIGCAFLFLTACQPDTALDAPLERVANADAQLGKIRRESQKAVARSKEKTLAVRESLESSVAEADGADAALQEARLELQTLVEEFAIYRHAYRTKLRDDLADKVFPEVKIAGLPTLRQFRVRSIKGGEIVYASSVGNGRIPFTSAPPAVATFLRLEEEAGDREAFPELIPRRDSDTDFAAESAFSLKEAEDLVNNPNISVGHQFVRAAKLRLNADYEHREKELNKALKNLDKTRVRLTQKRRRHREYNEYHKTNIRDGAITKLSRSIAKTDLRSKAIYERMNTLRELMRKNR